MSSFPAAILWDMDGTLIDSEPAWIRAQRRLVEASGGTWSDADGYALVGADMAATAAALQAVGVSVAADALIAELAAEVAAVLRAGIDWLPGAREVARAAAEAGIPQAIVTTSPRVISGVVADRLTFLGAVVTGEDVRRGKPDPEPYLIAAQRLGVDIRDCLAIEDSPTGLASAVASGARVVGVPHDTELLPDPAWTLVPTLAGVRLDAFFAALPGAG